MAGIGGWPTKYFTLHMKHATHKQLASKLANKGYDIVVKVDKEPAQLMHLYNCPEAMDISQVELGDGMKLAVVVDAQLSVPP